MTKLYICEKPSLAAALAGNLGKPVKKGNYYVVGDDYVAWLKGHIIELIMPDDYKPEWVRKVCTYSVLPMIPDTFRKRVKEGMGYPALYSGLKELAKKADVVVNVGDPDREGQYLVDEVLEMLGWHGKTERLFINAMDNSTITKALAAMEDNDSDKNHHMFRSAFCRDITDWLIGMNGSRKFTLDAGYSVAVGRVQVPILALVYRRNQEIDNFKPVKFYKVKGIHPVSGGNTFFSEWKPQENEMNVGFDSEGRLLDSSVAVGIAGKVKDRSGVLEKVVREHKSKPQPLPYSLATLQVSACAKLGISLKQLDEAMQALYETHKLLTYPRSDCEYIPESQFADASGILRMLSSIGDTETAKMATGADSTIKSRAFNTKKTTAHHAIIPTSVVPDFSKLTEVEKGVYLVAAQRYIMQFYPVYEYDSTKFVIKCEGEIFEASGSVTTVAGWKQFTRGDDSDGDGADKDKGENGSLPNLKEGDTVFFDDTAVVESVTKPPKRFTQKDLIAALCNAHKFVKDAGLKDVVKNIKGLGTPATRSKIIEKLLERGTLIEKPGKSKKVKELYTADEVVELINALPDELTYPDQTALIELDLDKVASGDMTEAEYKEKITRYIKKLMEIKGNFTPKARPADKDHPECPACHKGRLYLHEGKFGKFWSCSAYKEGCKAVFDDDKGKPVIIECPECHAGFLHRRTSKAGNPYWSCSNYAGGCKAIFYDDKGKPDIPPPPEKCPVCGKNMNRISTKKGKFWVCEDNRNGCKAPWFPDVKGKPQIIKCPNCNGFLVKREGKNGPFYGCSDFSCKTFFDVDPKTGKPVKKPKAAKK